MGKQPDKPKPELGYFEGRKDHLMRGGRQAESADRQEREAYPGMPVRSAYAHLLIIPDHVAAGDRMQARYIMDQIDKVLDLGEWTTNEFIRLHEMHKAWARRQAGVDPVFNMRGWQKKGAGHNLNPTLKALRDIQGLLVPIKHKKGGK